jgi:putative Mn2+ efflux pump MntP
MNPFEILAIAVGLAMDAFAVALASSVKLGHVHRSQVFRLAFHFGLFQAAMPIAGWYAGTLLHSQIAAYDHWIAFALLVFVGVKSIKDCLCELRDAEKQGANPEINRHDPTRGASLMILSLATSIDALAVGLSLAFLNVSIWIPVATIGVVTAVLTMFGMLLGARLGLRFGRAMEVAGGLILIAIGMKIVIDHTLAGLSVGG